MREGEKEGKKEGREGGKHDEIKSLAKGSTASKLQEC